ncbi:tyrosinase family protein [Larkinella bovis]|uniref:Tyrosinase family protein n=1 Tax=Larkinella bovis TaxID=683041 RepID=A0ABW0IM43_9BACT
MGSLTKKDKTANAGLDRARQIPPAVAPNPAATVEIMLNNAATGNAYLSWTPSSCSIRITNPPQADLSVTLRNKDTTRGGQVKFRTSYTAAEQDTLPLTVPGNGTAVTFFVGGKFGSPSTADQDGGIVAALTATGAVLRERTLMVRIRKNANTLTPAERDRFLSAYATLNASAATYQIFLDGHNAAADNEIHGRPAFLPWHRAFVLDIERRLQGIDPSVTVPYWRFDQPAPNLFSADFMGGTPNPAGRVAMNATNPLRNWTIGGAVGIVRIPRFNTTTNGGLVMSEADTLRLGTDFTGFSDMEGDPHGFAHTSFSTGPITSPATATRDPIFFLLHCNVDRLWAKWQGSLNLFNPLDTTTYSPQSGGTIGDNPGDTMWPWNGVTTGGRPPTATSGPMPRSSITSKPSALPTVGEMIDYIGKTQGNSNDFSYDDIPFS